MSRQFLVVSLVVALMFLPASLFSQSRRPGGTGMSSAMPTRLEIHVTAGNSRPLLDTQVYIEVSSFQGGAMRGYTDSEGRVNFDVPSGTTYRLSASGPGIDPASTSFDIPSGQRFHHEEIHVNLPAEGVESKRPGGLVSAVNLRVPEKAQHEFAKGMKEMSSHDWSKAREHFEKAIKDYPQFDWAYNNIGVAYIQEKNTSAAREAFEKAVAINDKNRDAVRNLARMKLMENDCIAGKQLLLKLPPDPKDFDALTMLAFAELRTHEFDAALANALKVHQGEPDRFPLAHLIAARVYEIKRNQNAARAQYQMYLQEAPNTAEAQLAKEGLQRVAVGK